MSAAQFGIDREAPDRFIRRAAKAMRDRCHDEECWCEGPFCRSVANWLDFTVARWESGHYDQANEKEALKVAAAYLKEDQP